MGLFDRLRRRRKPVTAAATPVTDYAVGHEMTTLVSDEHWQAQTRDWVSNGPGFIGWSVGLKALVCTMGAWRVEELDASGIWTPTDDPSENALLTGYRGVNGEDAASLYYRQVMSEEGWGEWFLVAHDTDAGPRFEVVQAPQLDRTVGGNEMLGIKGLPNSRMSGTSFKLVPRSQVVRIHNPDPTWPEMAYSPLKRCVPDIERYLSVVRSIKRSTDSRLISNGILWLASEAAQQYSARTDRNGRPRNFHNDFRNFAMRAYGDDTRPEAAVPFTLTTSGEHGPPQKVDLGREIDERALEAERAALEAVARGLDLPMKVVAEAERGMNHWGEWLLESSFLRTGAQPTGQRALDNVTMAWFRPTYRSLQALGVLDPAVDPARRRIGLDLANVAKNPDESRTLLAAWQAGIASRDTVAQRGLGLAEADVLELPEGMTDFDAWKELTGRGSPAAEPPSGEATDQVTGGIGGPPAVGGPRVASLSPEAWLADADLLDLVAG